MRQIRLLTAVWLLMASPLSAAEETLLQQARDMRALGNAAEQKRIPILLMVSQEHCGYCELMKQEVLDPMLLSEEYTDQVLMRELLIDPGESVINFAGRRQTAEAFSDGYSVWVTPTLLFLDPQGRQAAEPILGINTIDFLLFYIEDAIESAQSTMEPKPHSASGRLEGFQLLR